MKYALIITGCLAALAIEAPMLVVAGYFLFVIPGLILTFAPTVFVYLSATACIRRLMPNSSSMPTTVVAFCAAILLGWVVMQPFRLAAIAGYEANHLPDVTPPQAIKLDGHVRLEMLDRRGEPQCDHLCLAVVDSPEVQSLTLTTSGQRNGKRDGNGPDQSPCEAYALTSAEADPTPGIFPHEPGQIVHKFPLLVGRFEGRRFSDATKAVEANWAMRLTQEERLRKVQPVAAEDSDWVIRVENQTNDRVSTLRRITIVDSAGTVRFRKTHRKQVVPARMFYIGFRVNSGAGTISSASFHLGNEQLVDGDQSLQPETTLLSAIDFPVPRCDPNDLVVLRSQVDQTLNNPASSTVQLELARYYTGLFFFNATPQDHDLLARIVADERVQNLDEQLQNVFSKDKTPVAMRDAFAKRIVMQQTSASLRHWLAERLANLPPGTFSKPDESHVQIWTTPKLYQDAAPFLQSLADLDPQQAVPMLTAALSTAIEIPTWQARRSLIEGIRSAFIRLGPQASTAAPQIQELFLRRPSPITSNSKDADQWRFALARMGLEIPELPMFPTQSAQSVERIQRRVAEKLRRYEQDLALKDK